MFLMVTVTVTRWSTVASSYTPPQISHALPVGTAGGDLSGSYPNPALVAIVTPATLGDSTHVAQIQVDPKGRIVAGAAVLINALKSGDAAGGDLAGAYPNPSLAVVGLAIGPIGDATHVPVVTIDTKGRVTGLTSAVIVADGLYGTHIARPARAGQLVDNSGGVSGGNTVAVVDTVPHAADAVATLTARLNSLEAKVSAAGGGFGGTA